MSGSLFRKVSIHNIRCSRAYLSRFSTTAQPAVWTAADDAVKVTNSYTEGDDWDHNYSLAEDGVVNTKLAFRNAKLSTIMTRLPVKVASGKIAMDDVNISGKFTIMESGDNMTQEDFSALIEKQYVCMSSEKDLFFEDVGLGASASVRVGARMISENPVHALIFRSLMINIPPRPTDHRARYNGWNLDERWMVPEKTWNGTCFDIEEVQTVPKRGERPIVAFIGGVGDQIALQFQQQASGAALAGANIVAGSNASVRGIVEAFGMAGAAMINAESRSSLAIPSLALFKDGKTIVLVGDLSEELVSKAAASGALYGAYWNVLTDFGVSAMFNGVISPSAGIAGSTVFEGFAGTAPIPVVVSNSKAAVPLVPDNFSPVVDTLVFVGSNKKFTPEEAKNKLVELTGGDDSKNEIAGIIVKNATIVCTQDARKLVL